MADTVETAGPLSPADEAEKQPDARSAVPEDDADGREEATQGPEAQEVEAKTTDGRKQEAEAPKERAQGAEAAEDRPQGAEAAEERGDEAEEAEEREEAAEEAEEREEGAEEAEERGDGAKEGEEEEEARSLTELFELLGRQLSELGLSEAQLEAARNMPEVRRAARDIAGTLVVVIAALTAFAFLNVAAMAGLSTELDPWLAALVLAAIWSVVGGVLLLSVRRARQWLSWILLKAPPTEAVQELERERNADGRAALGTLEQLGPALAMQVAMAAVPKAGDVADGVVEVGGTVLEVSDEIVEIVSEQLPGGGVVNQVWDVALMPGRLGVKVATTVLRRGRPTDRAGAGTDGKAGPSS
jgi:hypothetical protein